MKLGSLLIAALILCATAANGADGSWLNRSSGLKSAVCWVEYGMLVKMYEADSNSSKSELGGG